jgi:diguanylate cyclase (GGDEF)-like protein
VPEGDQETLDLLRDVLPSLVADAHVALDRVRREAQLATSATTDSLTGLATRGVAMRQLSRLEPEDCIVMIDLDRFKALNDSLGHAAGDAVLRSFALALQDVRRASDTAGRHGGEEFVLLLPRTDAVGARRLLGRLRDAWLVVRPHPITFSAGVALVGEDDPRTALRRADDALYAAKRRGRDRVETAA